MRTPVLTLQPDADPKDVAPRAWAMLQDEGYLYLEGPMVSALPLERITAVARAFFARSDDYKMRYYIGHSPIHRGYLPTGEEGDPDCKPDIKEGFDTGLLNLTRPLAPSLESNPLTPWPDVPAFEETVVDYLRACEKLARSFASLLSRAFELGYDLNERATRPPNQLRLLRYPASPTPSSQGVGTHTDFECFTIMQVTGPGFSLQRPGGDWIDVPPRPNSAVVTIGDLIEVLTNGALSATPHRVGHVPTERYSFPYFFCLDANEVATPAPPFTKSGVSHYHSTPVGDHLTERTISVFRYLRNLRPEVE